jgi:hypothetical protein
VAAACFGGRCFGRKICWCDGDAVAVVVGAGVLWPDSALWVAVWGGGRGGGSAEAESTAVIVMVVVVSVMPSRCRLRSSTTAASSLWSSARVLVVVVVVVAAADGGGVGGVACVVVSLRFFGACRVSSCTASGVVLGRDTPCASSGARAPSGRRGVSSGMGL